jgi:antitoxin component YwqK of YwqJK toxin-antitoxin module
METWESVKPNIIRNGKWKEFNKHAVLIADGFYVDSNKHGTWREYYDETGTIMIEENYRLGVQHGRYASFHPNGQLLSEGQFSYGLRQGYFKVYDEQGNNIRNLFFINNIQIEGSNELIPAGERTSQRKTGS